MDTVKSCKDFEISFIERYWSDATQTEVHTQIYQGRYTTEGKKNYVDYFMNMPGTQHESTGVFRGHAWSLHPQIQNSWTAT
jgi:hypothetical protein